MFESGIVFRIPSVGCGISQEAIMEHWINITLRSNVSARDQNILSGVWGRFNH